MRTTNINDGHLPERMMYLVFVSMIRLNKVTKAQRRNLGSDELEDKDDTMLTIVST